MTLTSKSRKLIISLVGSGVIVAGGIVLALTTGGGSSSNSSPKQAKAVATQVVIVEAPVLPNEVWDTDLFEKTNAERKKAGIPALVNDGALAEVAHARALEMSAGHYLSHTSPSGETAVTAMAAAHYGFVTNAENLARVDKGETTADTMKGFMNSPRHHDTILDKKYTSIGIDSIVGTDGLRYVVVLFAGQTDTATQQTAPTNSSGPPAAPIEQAPAAPSGNTAPPNDAPAAPTAQP